MSVRVVVLGMHRSGSSAVARVINLLGVPLGDPADEMSAAPSNPTGHWESATLCALNDQVLEMLGGSWLAPPPIEAGIWTRPEITALQREAVDQFRRVHATESWVWKDPRNCLTFPFWRPIAKDCVAVLVSRDPRDVAASLSTRDGCSRMYGLALWERYARAALTNAAGLPTFVLGYANLLDDPRGVADRLDRFLRWAGLERVGKPGVEELCAFIDPQLNHARAIDTGIELSAGQSDLHGRIEALAGPHERFSPTPLPAETACTAEILEEKRGSERHAKHLESERRRIEERTRSAEALADARGIELERAAPYARDLESRIAKQEVEIDELRALVEGQAAALGLRLAEVEALGGALAERSALAARHLIDSRALRAELARLSGRTMELERLARLTLAARSALLRYLPAGSRRRAVCEAMIDTTGLRRRLG